MKRFFFTLIVFFSISLAYSQHTMVLKPSQDTYINSATPKINQGTSQSNIATTWTYDGKVGISRSLIDFNLNKLPRGAKIQSAHLSFYHDPISSHEGHTLNKNGAILQRITEPWNELSTTWNNKPKTTTTHETRINATLSSIEDCERIDVTRLVKDMKAAPYHSFGFMLKLDSETLKQSMVFASGDHPYGDLAPKLVITYTIDVT